MIFDNADFGYTQIIVNRPKRKDNGEIEIKGGVSVSDPSLRYKENIPLKDSIDEYFKKEVLPFDSDAYYNTETAKIGYEINFNKYFYKYSAPRTLEEITKDILALEVQTDGVLNDVIKK
jgi:type I restriction enzyme M protein